MRYHPLGDGRYVMRLDPGDEVIASLRQFASEEKVTSGYITGIGSTSSAVLGWLDPESGEYQKRKFDEPMEVGNLTGTISVAADDGRAFVHLHGVLAPRELLAYSGHIHEARTGAVMELFIFSFDVKLERHALPEKSFPWIVLPGEPLEGDKPADDSGDEAAGD
ncbi:MAG: DNA-binding protein [Planctomycetota bacterium]|nr:DNA-binding protein [Planctomycetota bacterium]